MWSSNMAVRWRGKDGDLNAGNSDFLCSNSPDEFALCRGDVDMDPQSCMDHSILAIFEDSAVSSEDKSRVEEESETLLSALTEMLDSVGDDDGTLSPFDTLPDTKLLTHQECRDTADVYLADRLRPRSKSPNLTFTRKNEGEKAEESKVEKNSLSQVPKQQSQTLFHPNSKKVENEVEVFTSTSLVNLVRLMHPYCLKLHVEEEGKGWESTARPSASSWNKLKKKHILFSQGEVWKYERPTEDSDEEINVVSDDEAPEKETEEGDEKRDDGKLLKSVLLNGNSSRAPSCREKKRVSFGPVQVASYDESGGKELNEKSQTSEHTSGITVSEALENPAGSALEAQTNPSSEINSNKAEVLPPKAETKAKSLSLQQYRQLRQKRQPLVEKQGNYTTKWPSVSEPPKELTPILCLHGQRRNSCGPKTAHYHSDCTRISADHLHRPSSHRTAPPPRPNPVEDKPSSRIRRSGLKCSKSESRVISPASPLPDVPESKKSPVKKPTLLSSDPPNPVLLPMPVTQTHSPSTAHSSSESKVELLNRDSSLTIPPHVQEIQNESTTPPSQTQPSSSEPKPKVLLPKQDCNLVSTGLLQEIKNKLTEIVPDTSSRSPALGPTTTQTESNSEYEEPQPQKSSLNPSKDIKLEPNIPQSPCPSSTPQPLTPLNTPIPVKEASPEVPSSVSPPEEPSLKLGCREQSAAGESGIEAPDLTSLLEQFEETQAKEEGECESELEPKLVSAASPPDLQTHSDLHRTQPTGTEKTAKQLPPPPAEPLKPLSTSESPGTPETIRNLPDLQMLELADIPEPLGTEIILSTQQARRKNPASKAIQIIDPRPLPSKKTNTSTSEFPAAHTAPHLYSSVFSDHDYCVPVDHSSTSATQRSRAKPSLVKDISKSTNEVQVTTHDSSAAAECRKQASTREVNTSVRAVNNSAKSVMQHLSESHGTRSETNPSTDEALSFSDSAASEQDCGGASEDKMSPCTLPTPPPSPPSRGREKRRYRRRSPRSGSSSSSCSSSSSSSSSASRSPKRPRLHHKRSESSSWSSSPSGSVSRSPPRRYRLSRSRPRCSRSRSRSWSHSRSPSRSPSPRTCSTHWRDVYSSRESRRFRREHEMRIQKLKAIDERRVVYVGRIRRSMTHDELRERFSQFGDVECVSLHFRDRGDHYGFVTFYNMEDAFAAIDNGGKLRRPDELPFDICFGGRRQFCNSNYADLDANRDADVSPARSRSEDLDFDSLLKQAQRGLKR